MTQPQSPPAGPPGESDRRSRPVLRALIDEMLRQLRDATHRDAWTAEERSRAEADLDRIMASVRREAMRLRSEGDSGGTGSDSDAP